jgi:hypothetical protein
MPYKNYYSRQRRKLMASVWVDKKLRDKWERMEKELGRAMTLEEFKDHIGYVNTMGRYVGPQGKR